MERFSFTKPSEEVTNIMDHLTGLYRFLSVDIWGGLPSSWQRIISQLYTSIYNAPWSRLIIQPYCNYHYQDPDYLNKFEPASGKTFYQDFQDFFSRKLKEPLNGQPSPIWPAEGLLCEYGPVKDLPLVKIKGEERHLKTAFGSVKDDIPNDYFFSNIFLHNNNYHRIHSPVDGTVSRIERIPGDLLLLRPWVYKNDPSLPALRNERVNLDIRDQKGKTWYLSVVGGPAVGTIKLPDNVRVGNEIRSGDELSIFMLGSTCCMAAPLPSTGPKVGDPVIVGKPL